MNRASAAMRLSLIGAVGVVAIFLACGTPWQRIDALAELLAASPATAHWSVPVGSVHNLYPAAQVTRILALTPQIAVSVRLLIAQAVVVVIFLWAALYSVARDALWSHREADLRQVAHGPRLAPVYPEGALVRLARLAVVLASVITAVTWLFEMHARLCVFRRL